MNLADYSKYDGLGLAALVRSGDVRPRELAECALAVIRTLNARINAVIETYEAVVPTIPDAAPHDCDAPFIGVPFLLKDLGAHDAGSKMELGSRLTEGLRAPPFASELVNRFRRAGVTILGRTNVPELGSACATEPQLYGPTRNPWNLERTPGGSSGGAAAAVASGMVPIAHANDAGGSIRWPASCCGLFGLKPSRNLNPVGPDAALLLNGFAAEHVLSRSVRDSAAMLDATAGPDEGAWCYTPRIEVPYLQAIATPVQRLKIGLNLKANFPVTALAPEVVRATRDAADLCVSLGHEVEEATLDFEPEPALRANSIIWATGIRQAVLTLSELTGRKPSPKTLEPHNWAAFEAGAAMSGTDLQWALDQLNDVARSYGRFFRKYDVMLTPTGAMEPFAVGHFPSLDASRFYDWYLAFMSHCPFTSSVNMAGVPAMSVPLTWSRDGLPLGSHFVAAMGREALLFGLAAQLEAARPWFHRTPPVFGGGIATQPAGS